MSWSWTAFQALPITAAAANSCQARVGGTVKWSKGSNRMNGATKYILVWNNQQNRTLRSPTHTKRQHKKNGVLPSLDIIRDIIWTVVQPAQAFWLRIGNIVSLNTATYEASTNLQSNTNATIVSVGKMQQYRILESTHLSWSRRNTQLPRWWYYIAI